MKFSAGDKVRIYDGSFIFEGIVVGPCPQPKKLLQVLRPEDKVYQWYHPKQMPQVATEETERVLGGTGWNRFNTL